MPILTYTPKDGGDPERFEFAFDDLAFTEVVELERLTKRNWGELEVLYWRSNFEVVGYLLVVLMRRTEPGLSMESLNLTPGQVAYDLTPAEQTRFIDNALRNVDLTDEQRALLTVERAKTADPAEVPEDPKA